MRILDESGNEIVDPNWELGYVEPEQIVIAHHEATEAVRAVWHYETVRVYPKRGKDVARVIDIPGSPYIPAWNETEIILRWHWYPPDGDENPQNIFPTDKR